jgi:hypothetical protein
MSLSACAVELKTILAGEDDNDDEKETTSNG